MNSMRIGGFELFAIWRATSANFTCSPISSTRTSPPRPIAPAWITSSTASWTVMKKRVTSGSVTVIGPPAAICARNVEDGPTALQHVAEAHAEKGSPRRGRLVRGETFADSLAVAQHAARVGGLVGGDVDEVLDSGRRRGSQQAGFPTRWSCTASPGSVSSSGRCFRAAAWKTTSGLRSREQPLEPGRSRMSRSTRSGESSSARPSIDSCTRVQRRLVAVDHDELGRAEPVRSGGTAPNRSTRRRR